MKKLEFRIYGKVKLYFDNFGLSYVYFCFFHLS